MLNKKIYFYLYFIVKVIFSIVVLNYSSTVVHVGDLLGYYNGGFNHREDFSSPAFMISYISTLFVSGFGGGVSILVVNFVFVWLAYKFYSVAHFRNVDFIVYILILNIPGFILWTSWLSKEYFLNIAYFALGFVLIGVKGGFVKVLLLLSVLFFVAFFKPYLSVVLALLVLCSNFYFIFAKNELLYALILSVLFIFLGMLVPVLDIINDYSITSVYEHFSHGTYTRNVSVFTEQGWFSSMKNFFFTVLGAFPQELQSMSVVYIFIESVLFFCIILFYLFYSSGNKVNSYFLVYLLIVLVLVTYIYPYSMWNLASGWRYKADIMILFFIFGFYLKAVRTKQIAW